MIQKISIVAAAALALAASAVSGQNLMTNGGFEAGNTSGWLASASATATVPAAFNHSAPVHHRKPR